MQHSHARSGLAAGLLAALIATAGPATAARVGQVQSSNTELRTVTIDGRQYRVLPGAELGYAEQPERQALFSDLRDDVPVEYELTEGDAPRIRRITILSAD